MAANVFSQHGVTPAGDPYWAIDAPTVGELGWRYIIVPTGDALHICGLNTRNGFYDRLRRLTEGAEYSQVFQRGSRWFPTANPELIPLASIQRLEEVELTHELAVVSQPAAGRAKRVSIITPGVPLYHELFGVLHARLCQHAEVKIEVASVGQLVRGPVVAIAAGVLLSILLVSALLATASGDAPPAEGRHSGILRAVGWLASQIGIAGVVGLCSAAVLVPVVWLLLRVSQRAPKRVIDVRPKSAAS